MYRKIRTNRIFYVVVGLALVSGAGIGLSFKIYADHLRNIKIIRSSPLREGVHGYEFINPLLACELSEKLAFKEMKDLSSKLNRMEDEAIYKKHLQQASIYVRDLTNSRWAQVNESKKFSPGSLMKVPLMIAILKYAESNPRFLNQKVWFSTRYEDESLKQHEQPSRPLAKGGSYSIADLLYSLIAYSDNNAVKLLFESVDGGYIDEVFQDIGIPLPSKEAQITEDYMTAKSYSLFFRILYNSTYLSRDFSNNALGLLARADYKKGLVAGIPPSMPIAHKFGEKIIRADNVELHDCGIVFLPDHPYLICVMTKGQQFESLENFIQSVSKVTFEYFQAQTD